MSDLSYLDLEGMVSPMFGIDVFDAKAGTNESVCVLSFRVSSESGAQDLSSFTEREGDWILDSDVSTGEDDTGKYLVFIELQRSRQLIAKILNLLEVIERLAGAMDWKFTVRKFQKRYACNQETLQKYVATTTEEYTAQLKEQRHQEMMEFFDGTVYNTLTVNENVLKLEQFFQPHRAHSSLKITILKENPNDEELHESMTSLKKQPNPSLSSWLERTLGANVQVEAMGSNFLLKNSKSNKSLLVKLHV